MGFKIDTREVADFVERIYPKGAYEGKIVGVEEKVGNSGREMFVLDIEVADTIPSGEYIDEETYVNPLGKKLKKYQCFPMEGDKQNTKDMFTAQLRDLIKFSGASVADDELNGDDFLNQYIGVTIGHSKINRDDPNSGVRAEISGYCALPE